MEQSLDIVARHKAVFDSAPRDVPRGITATAFEHSGMELTKTWGTSVDAPLLGNGDLLAAFSGEPQWPQFWLSTNDFWEMKSDGWDLQTHSYGQCGARPIGRIILKASAMEGARYRVEQDLATAVTTARFETADRVLVLKSFVAATENVLMVELEAEGGFVEVALDFKFPNETGEGVSQFAPFKLTIPTQIKEWSQGVLCATRAYETGVDQPVKAVVAAKFVGVEGDKVSVTPGSPVKLAVVVRTWEKTIRPFEFARSRAAYISHEDAESILELHQAWWRNYWSVSHVELDDPVMEQRYYLSLYVSGSLIRDPKFPPSIFGAQTWDDPGWAGDYKLNYNHEAPYYGLYGSGRFEQADVHDAPYLALMEQGHETARKQFGHRGIMFGLGIGPKGLVCENGHWGNKSYLAFGCVNMSIRWNLTREINYGWKIYPFVREVVDFWEDDLVWEDGRYSTKNDCAHETPGDYAKNGGNGLGYIRVAFKLAMDVSEALGVDESRREKWRHILECLSPLPTAKASEIKKIFGLPGVAMKDVFPSELLEGREVLCLEEDGVQWGLFCAVALQNVYSNGIIGLDSDPKLLEIARNTLELKAAYQKNSAQWSKRWAFKFDPGVLNSGGWRDFNHTCLFYPAAVRLGHDPDTVWNELRSLILDLGAPNGFLKNNPSGMEQTSTVPTTIHEMMLMSYEGVIRVFRSWPRKSHPNASFEGLRAVGAFKVSAYLCNGEVGEVRLTSLQGRDCTLENPWPGRKIRLVRNGDREELLTGARVTFMTRPGETMTLGAH